MYQFAGATLAAVFWKWGQKLLVSAEQQMVGEQYGAFADKQKNPD